MTEKVEEVCKKYYVILAEQRKRNKILQESAIRDYQFSDDEIFDNATHTFLLRLGQAVREDLREAHRNG